ncbi:MAG: hypothetical protein CM15mP59_1530 [Flavobacteriaceae bacterium]|nr:MAG: hypothetical protein CM15mP59_1530 [Flavobacteriaceae bacterium]
MLLPGLITIATPVVIGLFMGPEALGSYMAGVAVSGVLWAIFQNNAGGAWDNAKKSFEAGVEINGKVEKKVLTHTKLQSLATQLGILLKTPQVHR